MRIFLPLKHDDRTWTGEHPGSFLYLVYEGQPPIAVETDGRLFGVGNATESAYTLGELEDPEWFVELVLYG